MTLEPCNIVCPNCGNGNYMRYLVGDNVGRLNVKCINCNSYFNFWELHDLQNASTDEYIARKTILEELNSRIEQYVSQGQNARARAISAFGRFVRELPAADVVERKAGRWLPIPNGKIKNWKQKCSVCGLIRRGKTTYCPECGAKMIGGDDDV